MIHTFLSKEYYFLKVQFSKKHYTDNRKGSPFHYLARLVEGHGRLRSCGEMIELNEGDVFYIPKDIPYESFWDGDKIVWYSYGFSDFPEASQTSFKIQKIHCEERLKEEVSSIPTPPAIDSRTLASFFTVLSRLIPLMETDTHSGVEQIFRKSKALMENHPDQSISQIASACSVSDSTLYLIYKKICGKTPNTLRQEILVQKAIILLSSTDKSVQEISDQLGFSSTSYFRKILKKHTSCTPSQIKQTTVSSV